MTPGNNWSSQLDGMLRKAQTAQQAAVPVNEQQRMRDGLLHFFQPVFDVFTKLSESNIQVRTIAGMPPHRLIGGVPLKQVAERSNILDVMVKIAPETWINIRPAVKEGATYPDSIITAKFRCRIIDSGNDIYSAFVDNRVALAEWVFRHVLEYAVTPETALPVPPPAAETEPVPEPIVLGREHRVIELDDNQSQ